MFFVFFFFYKTSTNNYSTIASSSARRPTSLPTIVWNTCRCLLKSHQNYTNKCWKAATLKKHAPPFKQPSQDSLPSPQALLRPFCKSIWNLLALGRSTTACGSKL